jgi:hypothetical protein
VRLPHNAAFEFVTDAINVNYGIAVRYQPVTLDAGSSAVTGDAGIRRRDPPHADQPQTACQAIQPESTVFQASPPAEGRRAMVRPRCSHDAIPMLDLCVGPIHILISLQNRASCCGLQANGRGKAAPPLSRPALACSSRRHIHVPERFCKPLILTLQQAVEQLLERAAVTDGTDREAWNRCVVQT